MQIKSDDILVLRNTDTYKIPIKDYVLALATVSSLLLINLIKENHKVRANV